MTDEMSQFTSAQQNTNIVVGPDRVPLPTFIKNNKCPMSLQNWNNSGLCTTDPLVDDTTYPV
jgi:hypothetical protein